MDDRVKTMDHRKVWREPGSNREFSQESPLKPTRNQPPIFLQYLSAKRVITKGFGGLSNPYAKSRDAKRLAVWSITFKD